MGAILAGYVGFAVSMPFPIHLIVAILAGILGGCDLGWDRRCAQVPDRGP